MADSSLDSVFASPTRPGMTRQQSLPVFGQHLLAGLRQPRAMLLEAGEHHLVTVPHTSPAEPRYVARAGIMPRLLRLRRRRQNDHRKAQGHRNENSAHGVRLAPGTSKSLNPS